MDAVLPVNSDQWWLPLRRSGAVKLIRARAGAALCERWLISEMEPKLEPNLQVAARPGVV